MASQTKNLPEVGIDMTPMIDVVFQLLIFFMLVSQMVQLERAELELPIAEQAIKNDSNGDVRQMVINVYKEGKLEISSTIVTWEELQNLLENEAKISQEPDGSSSRVVSVRADIEAPYRIVKRILFECAKKRIYRIAFETKQAPK